jgi:signal peptidase I
MPEKDAVGSQSPPSSATNHDPDRAGVAPSSPASDTHLETTVEGSPRAHAGSRSGDKEKKPETKHTTRETFETIVFVLCLVLLLKSFVAEAFVIPTGSRATTLLGEHRRVECDHCKYRFTVNASKESVHYTHCVCPNCRRLVSLVDQEGKFRFGLSGGEKVLVSKFQYDLFDPKRWDVFVFKYPNGPQEDYSAKNYIKRLVGLPGDQLVFWYGDIYEQKEGILRKPLLPMGDMRRIVHENDFQDPSLGPKFQRWTSEAWRSEDGKTFHVEAKAEPSWLRYHHVLPVLPPLNELQNLFQALHDLQKNPELIQTLRDHERKELAEIDRRLNAAWLYVLAPIDPSHPEQSPPKLEANQVGELEQRLEKLQEQLKERQPKLGEKPSERDPLGTEQSRLTTLGQLISKLKDATSTLKTELEQYQAFTAEPRPQLITDLVGYNTPFTFVGAGGASLPLPLWNPHWVGDLMLELEVEVSKPEGKLTLELLEGVDSHRAIFHLDSGICHLESTRDGVSLKHKQNGQSLERTQAESRLNGTGSAKKHKLVFANFDDRLTVWVDGKLPFGDGVEFASIEEPKEKGPRRADLQPVSIAAENANVTVRKLKLWRDLYYTSEVKADVTFANDKSPVALARLLSLYDVPDGKKPQEWEKLYHLRPAVYLVQPDSYFAAGDNSTNSSDSRDGWQVAKRYLLGKAAFVYWPLWPGRFGPIR